MIVTVRRCRCALAFLLLLALGSLGARSAEAAIYYVGTGPTCGDQPNDRPSLAAALLSAAFTTANDEIRLTGTLTYANQALSLVDWHAGVAGTLTLAGGYTDCDDAGASGRTALSGQAGDSLIAVTTASQPTSVVTLRALELSGAEFRGVVVGDGAQVTLQNVWIHDNAGGVLVSSGGELSGDSATEVTDNELTLNGGGISCSGAGSAVLFAGNLMRNVTQGGGGNLYVGPGCTTELLDGALIEGNGEFPGGPGEDASFGGGIFVDNGILVASGGANRVVVRQHDVSIVGQGGGIFATGASAVVSLLNTAIQDNSARISGAAIHAENGAFVTLDRVAPCPFIFSCSDLRSNRLWGGVDGEAVSIDDAFVRLERTVVVGNGVQSMVSEANARNIFSVENGGLLELDGVLVFQNFAARIAEVRTGGALTAQYVTAVGNSYEIDDLIFDPWVAVADAGDVAFYSSILDDTKGFHASGGGTTTADCLLVDSATGLDPGTFVIGVPQFINEGSGDVRQLASSPGVDFCDQSLVPWPGSADVELQVRGVDEPTNPNGSPGITGGKFDVGFDEVVSSSYIFVDGFVSGNTSAWSSTLP